MRWIKVVMVLFSVFYSLTLRCLGSGPEKNNRIPDIPGYYTLKCDFHIHTVFSDGKVWPEIRIAEAIKEGLDAIAITEHLKYGKRSKYKEMQFEDRNRSFEIAYETAKNSDLIVIRGVEITQGMPPGHINAIFLKDANIAQKDFNETFAKAKDQGAFLFWNHPNWKSPDKSWEQDGIPQWFDIHTKMLDNHTLMGIEVVNARSYSKEVHQWCIDKNLTMLANSDIHFPIGMEYELVTEHRPMTLVFAKERTEVGIKEALMNQRTALWFENNIIGNENFLAPIFQKSVVVKKVSYHEKIAEVVLENESAVDFILENVGDYSLFNKTKIFILKAGNELKIGVKTGEVLEQFALKFKVHNLLVSPNDCLVAQISCNTD